MENPANSKIIFIINPIAGTRQKQVVHEAITRTFSPEEHEVFFTAYGGNAFEIAAQKVTEGYQNIVAVGGDGTVNEVASALVNTTCRLGIIPAGSGNGLARHLRIPLAFSDSLKVLRDPEIRTIDAGQVNGRYFFCTCGTGFDAIVGKKFAHESKRGMISYVRATIHQYINYSPKKYILKAENKKVELKAFLVTFANSGQYGNNAYIAPNALIDDGWLDLCVLRPFPRTSTLELGLRLFFKNIDQSPYLEVMRVKKATLKRKNKQKITLHLDGEPVTEKSKLKVKVVPGALNVMTPHPKRHAMFKF
ncbi:MAG TPA: diacylglycerol kinase family protein [Bacteroidales bacterium]|jgi:YegS/Rv2252/BmrU family lipid kinase|nr:diacylglycerol kinase family protein [Bacteroidales bacterium]